MNKNHKNANPGKCLEKELLTQLVSVAITDGQIYKNERAIIFEFGRRKGMNDNDITMCIEHAIRMSRKQALDLEGRFQLMHYIVRIILAGGAINNNKIRTATSVGLKFGFREEEVSSLMYILINGIKSGENPERLLETFRLKNMNSVEV